MYKDVGKRILAVVVAICLVIVLVNVPGLEVKASDKIYHDYIYGESAGAGFVETHTAATVFQANQNESGGAEILSSISFDIHAEYEGALDGTGANVAVYTGAAPGNPESGVFLCSNELYPLVEGTNEISFEMGSAKINHGEYFAVIVTLTGDGLSFYTDTFHEVQRTLIRQEDGSWKDMAEEGKSVSIRAATYDEGILAPVKESIAERVSSFMSGLSFEEPVIISEESAAQTMEESQEDDTAEEAVGETEVATKNEQISQFGETQNEIDGTTSSPGGVELNLNTLVLAVGTGYELKVKDPVEGRTYEWCCTGAAGTSGAVKFMDGDQEKDEATGTKVYIKAFTEIKTITIQVTEKLNGDLKRTGSCDVTVVESTLDLEMNDIDNVIYNGSEQKQPVYVRIKTNDGSSVPANPNHYAVTYAGDYINVGEISVTVSGDGIYYSGNGITKTYRILPKPLEAGFVETDENGIAVTITKDENGTVTQQEIEQAVAAKVIYKVEAGKELLLEPGTDYKFTGWEEDSLSEGTHSVTIAAIDSEKCNYSGSITVTYNIRKNIADADVKVLEGNFGGAYVYTGSEITPEVIVNYLGRQLTRGTDYEVEYQNNIAAGKGIIVIKGIGNFSGELTKEFEIAKKYFTNYNASEMPVIIQAKGMESVPDPGLDYAGVFLHPEYSVTYIGTELTEGVDYEISTERIDDTTAKITFTGIGNFCESRTLTYSVGIDIEQYITENHFTINLGIATPYVYTGKEVELDNITIGDLVQGKDFIAECKNAKDAGTAQVYIHGYGKYAGTYHMNGDAAKPSAEFEIVARDLSTIEDSNFLLSEVNVTYSKIPENMKPTVSLVYQGTVIDPAEYSVSYEPDEQLIEGENHIITVLPNGSNFTGEKILKYHIIAADLNESNTKVTLKTSDYRYTGKPIDVSKDITVEYFNGKTWEVLELNTDYQIYYDVPNGDTQDNYMTTCGLKWIEIRGIGNFTGFLSQSYNISKIPLNEVTIEIDQLDADVCSYVKELLGSQAAYRAYRRYTGSPQEPSVKSITYTEDDGNVVTLKEDTDYVVSYKNSTEMSKLGETAYIVITAKNSKQSSCAGELIIPYVIYKEVADIDDVTDPLYIRNITGVPDNVTYTGKEINFDDEVMVTTKDGTGLFAKETELELNTDYFITYDPVDNINVGTGKKVVIHGRPQEDILTANGCYVIHYEKEYSIDQRALNTITDADYEKISRTYENKPVTLTEEDFSNMKLGVTIEDGEHLPLKYGTDFVVSEYSGNNGITNGATAKVKISGQGNFYGTKWLSFTIVGKSIMNVTVESIDNLVYDVNRVERVPDFVLKDGNYTLQKNVDYEIVSMPGESYIDATKEAYVYIKGIGNYKSSDENEIRAIRYEILPLDISNEKLAERQDRMELKGMNASYIYTFEPGGVKPEPTDILYWLSGAQQGVRLGKNDYEILPYGTAAENAGTAKLQIQGIGNFTGVYTQEYTITEKDISVLRDQDKAEDEGMSIEKIPIQFFNEVYATYATPDVVITHNGVQLEKDKDYTLTYKNNFGIRKNAQVIVTAKGNYTGTITRTFEIQQSIENNENIKITFDENQTYTYTGEVIWPEVTIRNGVTNVRLKEGTDYEISIPDGYDNISAGPAKIIVRGIGKYGGEIPYDFRILPQSILNEAVEVSLPNGSDYEYTGQHIAPEVTVTYHGQEIDEYEIVTSERYTEVGIGKVVIKGIGNFGTGETREITFHIVPRSVGRNESLAVGFNAVLTSQKYTGEPIELKPEITYNGRTLTLGTDYTFSDYQNNVDIGVATFQLNGRNNFTGSVTLSFTIRGTMDNTNTIVTLPETRYPAVVANGVFQAVTPEPAVMYRYSDGRLVTLTSSDYTVEYRNNLQIGEATVLVKGKGVYEGAATTTFKITGNLKDAVVDEIPLQPYDDGKIIIPEVRVTYFGQELIPGRDYKTISNSSEITPEGSKEVLTIQGIEGGYFEGTSTTAEFRIVESVGLTISIVNPGSYTYSGKSITPEVTVKYDGQKLESGYTVSIAPGSNVNAGSLAGTVKVSYVPEGQTKAVTAEKQFTINAFDISQDNVLVRDDGVYGHIRDMEYLGGKEIIPNNFELVYQPEGQEELVFDSNMFTLTFPDGDNIYPKDNIRVQIQANTRNANNIIGSKETTFKIVRRDLANTTIVADSTDCIYTGDVVLPDIAIVNHPNAVKNIDYIITPLLNGEYDNCRQGKQMALVEGIGDCYTGSQLVEYSISPLNIDSPDVVVEEIPDQTYTGKEVKPENIVVYYRGVQLTSDDYAVTFENNINVGTTAAATVSGKGNFNGSTKKYFAIIPADINGAELKPIPNAVYTGAPVSAEINLSFGGKALVQGTDYTVEYEGTHTELGEVKLNIRGRGSFTGVKEATFRIVADSIESAEIEGLEDSYTYTGEPIRPEENVVVKIGTTALTKGVDYEFSYGENVNVGTGTLTVVGQGEMYGGSKDFTFRITEKSISDQDVILDGFMERLPYSGEPAVQKVTLKYGDISLVEGTDYILDCTNNNAVTADARMTITGIGNFAGTVEKTYTITAATFDDAEISNISSVYTYTGEAITPDPVVNVGGNFLTEGVDYTISIRDNVDAGTATITLNGMGNYQGSVKEVKFQILSKSIQRAAYEPIEDQLYNGVAVTPDVSLSDNGNALVVGTDYDLSYQKNSEPGTARAIAVGRGNYRATRYITYQIKVGAVDTLISTEFTDSSVTLNWSHEGVVTGYEIYRDDGNGQYQLIARTAKTSYTNQNLTTETKYSYFVRAYYLAPEDETYYGQVSPTLEVTTR